MAAVTICSDLESPKIKSLTVSIVSPSICHEVMGLDAMILIFWMLSFKPTFSLYSFTLIKRLFSSSLLALIRVVSPAYLRLLIFLPAIFHFFISTSANLSLSLLANFTFKKDIGMTKGHMKRWSTSLIIREMQIKTIMRDHFTQVRLAIIKKSSNNKC